MHECTEEQQSLLLPQAHNYKTLRIVLIKPSQYDDDGYMIRFWKAVLPSNTLSVLQGLTEDIKQRRVFGDMTIQVDTFDEVAEKVPVARIVTWDRHPSVKLLVCLVGVQTPQFPRAVELGKQFRKHGIDVLMGGFHTSGTINMLGDQGPDIQGLYRESIIVIAGEVEGHWEGILADVLNGQLKPLYSFAQDLKQLVDIDNAPLPIISRKTMKHFARPNFGTVETSRGCPFTCSFCTIINVQGRMMRERSPEAITELVRRNYVERGIDFYFFTDDNFARKKWWRETFEAIIRLRAEGIKITFMMQVDLARKPEDFVRLAAEAGCTQVFVGMESVNPDNIKAQGKGQNKVGEYKAIIREWHDVGVVVHVAYIIGMPFDSEAQVALDIQYLMDEIEPDQASFFMLTPLPGSQDHKEMHESGEWMDPDLNKRDSFHATTIHPLMTTEQWTAAYQGAWRSFYSKENMANVLARWQHNPRAYWNLLNVYLWYKNAALIEKQHPMVAGFFRLKDRLIRRPGCSVDPLPVHLWKRSKEVCCLLVSWARFLKEMEEVWLQTRPRSERERQFFDEVQRIQGEIWQTLKIAEWQKTYNDVKTALPAKARALLDPFEELTSRMLLSRNDLNAFLKKWGSLQAQIQTLHRCWAWGDGPAKKWLEQLQVLHRDTRQSMKVHEWQAVYAGFKDRLPSRLDLLYARFDVLNNRIVYSRQNPNTCWMKTRERLSGMHSWYMQPFRFVITAYKELLLAKAFIRSLLASMHEKRTEEGRSPQHNAR